MIKQKRGRMKSKLLFLAIAAVYILLIFLSSLVSAADPGHGAAVIGSGTFESGNYVFPNNLSVTGNVGIGARYENVNKNQNAINCSSLLTVSILPNDICGRRMFSLCNSVLEDFL